MTMTGNWKLVDFHCHLDLFPNHVNAFQQSKKDNIHILSVTTTPRAWRENLKLAGPNSLIRIGLGLHPQIIGEKWKEITLWEELFPQARYIGEIGLDNGPGFYQHMNLQKHVFERILKRCAESGGRVLSVHSMGCSSTVLDMIEKILPLNRNRVVLHWFTGTQKEAQRAIELGCYFSVNKAMLQSQRHQKMVLTLLPERIITETDSPFTKFPGPPIWPKDVKQTVTALSHLLGIEENEMGALIERNLNKLEEVI